jgi:hypothetical protein
VNVLWGLAVNPALPMELMLRMLVPDVLPGVLPSVALRAGLPEPVVDALVGHTDFKARACFAGNPHMTAETRSRLAADPDYRVRWALAAGPEWHRFQPRTTPLTDAAYDLLARDPHIEVRGELAQQWQTPGRVLAVLAADPEPEARGYVCRHWDTLPEAVKTALSNDPDPSVRRSVARHGWRERPDLFDEQVEELAEELVGEAPVPRVIAERYARSADAGHRRRIAGNAYLDRDLVDELAGDYDPGVRLEVSLRPELTEAERAAVDHDPDLYRVYVPLRWIRDGFADAGLMARCAASAHVVLRRSVACNPSLSLDLVERLACDDDRAVRLLLAEHHPDAPADLLLRVVLDDSGYSESVLTRRPHFPRAGLARLADSPDPHERRLSLLDPLTPAQAVERLSHDESRAVRMAMACDPRLPVTRLLEMLHDPDDHVRYAAAGNPALPAEVMTRIIHEAVAMARGDRAPASLPEGAPRQLGA